MQITGTKITHNGAPFIPKGANIGVNYQIGGNVWSDESTAPHTAEATAWGWNTVRLVTYVSNETSWVRSNGRDKCIAQTFTAAQKYLDAGFVVIIAVMDSTGKNPNAATAADIEDFARKTGVRFAGQDRLWFNVNEPSLGSSAAFIAVQDRFYSAFRENSASIYVADIMTNAQDGSWGTAPKIYDPTAGPAFQSGRSNVLFALHNYGGQSQNTTSQDGFNSQYTRHLQTCIDAGLPMIIGETGYRVDSKDQAGNTGDVNRNVRGFRASIVAGETHGIGVLVWHGTFDLFGLKNTLQNGGWHTRPFWYLGADGDLSPMGVEFWEYCHRPVPAPEPKLTVKSLIVTFSGRTYTAKFVVNANVEQTVASVSVAVNGVVTNPTAARTWPEGDTSLTFTGGVSSAGTYEFNVAWKRTDVWYHAPLKTTATAT